MSDLMGMNMVPMANQQLMRQSHQVEGAQQSRAVLDQLRSGARGTDTESTRQALRTAAQEFEGVFMNQLVSAMRKTVGDGGLIQKSQGEKMFEGMLDEQWARGLAGRHGPGGLSEMIYRQLSRQMGLDDEVDPTAISRAPQHTPGHPLLTQPVSPPPAGLIDDER